MKKWKQFLSILNAPPTPVLGLDLGHGAVKAVELSRDSKTGQLVLERLSCETMHQGALSAGSVQEFEQAIQSTERAVRRLSSRLKHAAIALPSTEVLTRRIALPRTLGDEDVEADVASEANQYMPFPADEVSIDWRILGPSQRDPENDNDVVIYAVRREKVEERVGVVEGAGMQVAVVSTEHAAVQSALTWIVGQYFGPSFSDPGYDLVSQGGLPTWLAVDLSFTQTRFFFFKGKTLILVKEGQSPLEQVLQDLLRAGHEQEQVMLAMRGDSEARSTLGDAWNGASQAAAHMWSMEADRAINAYITQTGDDRLEHTWLFGGGATWPGVAEAMGERLIGTVERLNPFTNMRLGSAVTNLATRIEREAPIYAVAMGLALRRFDAQGA